MRKNVILKACNWNIMSKTTPIYSEKINLEFTLGLSFQDVPPFLGRDKMARCNWFLTVCCFTNPLLIFATQSLIISVEPIKFCIILLGQSLYFLQNQIITDNVGSPNHLCNASIAELGCLTCLLQSMTRNV